MIVLLDSNQVCHQLYHMEASQAKRENREVDTSDTLEWWFVKLDHIKRYHERQQEWLAQQGIDDSPLILIAVFDSTAKSWRAGVYPDYKAQRTRTVEVYDLVRDAQAAMVSSDEWLCMVSPDTMEADDLIASIAHQESCPVIIHSSDKDFNQCLQPGRVGIVKRSWTNEVDPNNFGIPLGSELECEHFRAEDFEGKFGFPLARWIDYQAIVGDTADNIKGWEWVGEKTAKKILARHPYDPLEHLGHFDFKYSGVTKRGFDCQADFFDWLPILRSILTLRTDLQYVLKPEANLC